MTIPQAFELALQHHQSGRLAEAEGLYRQILAVDPRQAGALHLLGVVAHQLGRNDVAVELMRRALALAPGVPALHSDLGEAYRGLGQLDEAIAAYRQAIALQPDFPGAHSNLGIALRDKGQLNEAIAAYRQAIALQPNLPVAHNNLGNALQDKGQLEEAITAFRQAVALHPNYPEAYSNLGNALKNRGRLDEAIASYHQAVALRPNLSEAHTNLGVALQDKGQLDEAIAAHRQAIALKPNFSEAHYNLGIALHGKGQIDAAVVAYRQAIALRPNYPEAQCNLGNALREQGQLAEGIGAYRRAISLKPEFPEAHSNLGNALKDQGQLDEAIAAYRQAISHRPNYPDAHNNLGNALKDQGRLDEAIAAYRQAIALKPNFRDGHSNLIYAMHFHCSEDALAIREEHRRWNRQFAEPLRRFHRAHPNERDPERRLRIGYVSPDFREHVGACVVVPLFEAHDRSLYELHAYASVSRPDRISERLRRSVSAWHDVRRLGNEELAERIRQDGIDILIDLTMHMAHNRLPLFACKPAPIQVTWLAYPGSTGLETIDYRLTDALMDPPSPGTEGCSEESVRLPDSWCCYDPISNLPQAPVETSHWGEFVRFGSLNNFCKLNEPLLRLWGQVLAAVPGSRLLLLAAEGRHRDDLRRTMETMGIAGHRVEFCGRCSRDEYLRLYDRIDIALDPVPYNGVTTTLDALWMGVPVVSLAGKTAAGRAGLSLLSTAGLAELATRTPEEFVGVASGLAQDRPRLAQLRSTLRSRMEASPLMDAPRFARNIEAAYRTAWRRWCGEKQPLLP